MDFFKSVLKKGVTLAAAFFMAVALAPVNVFAADSDVPEGAVAKVESTGEYYDTLQEALDAAKEIMVDVDHENQTVTLVADTTESVSVPWVKTRDTANDFNLTVDLAGHTVTGNGSASVFSFSNTSSYGASYHMNVTINDSSTEKTGTVRGGVASSGGGIYFNGKSGDTLTINGGTFTDNTASTGGAVYSSTSTASVVVNGGTFTGNTASSGGAIASLNLTVNGGVITGNSAVGSTSTTGRGGAVYVYTNSTIHLTVTGGQIYGNTAENYGDDIVFASTKATGVANSSMQLIDAASMGVKEVYGWYVDGYNGTISAGATARYSDDSMTEFKDYADYSGTEVRGNVLALKAASGPTLAVTYTDGVEDEVLFEDQVYNVPEGYATPAFDGTPSRTGYTFAGWTPEVASTVTDNATYTAVWSANEYTLTLDPANGEKSVDVDVTYDAAVGKLPTPLREGYTFEGWYDEDGNEVTSETVYQYTEDVTLTARWTANEYTLTLDAGNGEDPVELTVVYDAAVGTLPTPEREGYTFEGWYDEDGNEVTSETVYQYADDVTLSAKWSAVSSETPDVPETPGTPTTPGTDKEESGSVTTDTPNTGDNGTLYASMMLMLMSVAGLAILLGKKARKEVR